MTPFVIAMALGGCGSVQPAQTQPSEMLPSNPTLPKVGICHNKLVSDEADVLRAARRACGASGEPHLIDEDNKLTCPLSVPNRSTFACGPEKQSPPK
ncbi:MAG TPA: hypothetical protein VNT30_16875 [Stellaceae bacterium]|nr:hypothetical protein [Stellaceae bacterium]